MSVPSAQPALTVTCTVPTPSMTTSAQSIIARIRSANVQAPLTSVIGSSARNSSPRPSGR